MPLLDLRKGLRLTRYVGSDQSEGFTPVDLYKGGKLGFYYNSDDAAVSIGSPVDTLTDRSGNGLTISNTNSDQQPVLINNAALGANYMAFDGVDDRLQSAVSYDFRSAGGFTMYALITPRNVVNRGRLYTFGSLYLELPRSSSGLLRQIVPGRNTSVSNSVIPESWLDQVSCLVITHELAIDQLRLRINGNEIILGRTPDPRSSYSQSSFALCSRQNGGTHNGNIDVYEFGIVEGAASAKDITDIESYLMTKGNII